MKKKGKYDFQIDNWEVRYNPLMGEFMVDFFYKGKLVNVIGKRKTYGGAYSMALGYITKYKKYHEKQN